MDIMLEDRMRAAGLRVTSGRVAVLRALGDRPHTDAEQLHRMLLSTDDAALTLQAVHNVLGDLTRAGLLRRIEPERSPALYERRVGDNHHHVVCTSCGAVGDIDCVIGHAPCLTPSDDNGFVIDAADVVFRGLCANCRDASADSASLPTPIHQETP
jgi:Fur family transcriptional regulator, stress-responsive regulator